VFLDSGRGQGTIRTAQTGVSRKGFHLFGCGPAALSAEFQLSFSILFLPRRSDRLRQPVKVHRLPVQNGITLKAYLVFALFRAFTRDVEAALD
jgi:hypothetical protein